MEEIEIEVRALDGRRMHVALSPAAIASQVEKVVSEEWGIMRGVVLYHGGRKVSRDENVVELTKRSNCRFLTVLGETKRRRGRGRWEQQKEDENRLSAAAAASSVPSPSKMKGTLLPGYAHRPSHSSPLKKMSAVGNTETNHHREPMNIQPMNLSSKLHRAGTKPIDTLSTSSHDETPFQVARLEYIFRCLNVIYQFLVQKRVEPTWGNLRLAINELASKQEELKSSPIGHVDIEDIALICPSLVTIRKKRTFDDGNVDFIIDMHDPRTQSKGGKTAVKRREAEFVSIFKAAVENAVQTGGHVTLDLLLAEALKSEENASKRRDCQIRPPKAIHRSEGSSSEEPLRPTPFLEHLKSLAFYDGQIVHVEHLCRRDAVHGEVKEKLSDKLREYLGKLGIDGLFSHQVLAIDAIRGGSHAVVATSTSSGKSLCYNIPVMERLLQEPKSCALYLFPTKALARDQRANIFKILEGIDLAHIDLSIYDGDTPERARSAIRTSAQLLITNPDMLHVSILPRHGEFHFIKTLRYIVIDEGHMYKGVFGSHVAMVMRRLFRICRQIYGLEPQIIVSSATIANPVAHASALSGIDESAFLLVEEDGSPHGEKKIVLWNPPLETTKTKKPPKKKKKRTAHGRDTAAAASTQEGLKVTAKAKATKERENCVAQNECGPETRPGKENNNRDDDDENQQDGEDMLSLPRRKDWKQHYNPDKMYGLKIDKRRSPIVETSTLLAECVQHGLKTIAFCKTRKLCELVLAYTREILKFTGHKYGKPTITQLADRLAVYRGGYSVDERRAVESALFSGSLAGVAATNALELGIDVGDLDCTLHLGWQGSIASLWQQSGRAGRRKQEAISFFIAFNGPLDQHFMRHPSKLFGKSIECAHIDLHNTMILESHVECAAHEKCLSLEDDSQYFGPSFHSVAESLREKGLISKHPTNHACALLYHTAEPPASQISLRMIDPERYSIIEEKSGRILEQVEASKAFYEIYDGAVYMNQGRSFLCKKLNLEAKVAIVHPAGVKYYTRVVDHRDVCVMGGRPAYSCHSAPELCERTASKHSNAKIVIRTLGFHRIWQGTGKVFDTVDLYMPDITYNTETVYLKLPTTCRDVLENAGCPLLEGIHAACHALLNVVPLHLMCSPEDLCTECNLSYGSGYKPPERLLLYDSHPGGNGLSARIHGQFTTFIELALALVEECECVEEAGCPSCIQHSHCTVYNDMLHKQAAILVLRECLKHERKCVQRG